MCDGAAILKLNLIMLSLGPTFRIRAPTVALDNSVVILEVLYIAWFRDIFSPPSFSCLISFASALYWYGVCFAMVSNEIDSFANELSTRQIMHAPSRKTREIQFSRRKTKDTLKRKKIFGTPILEFQLRNLPQNINSRRRPLD